MAQTVAQIKDAGLEVTPEWGATVAALDHFLQGRNEFQRHLFAQKQKQFVLQASPELKKSQHLVAFIPGIDMILVDED